MADFDMDENDEAVLAEEIMDGRKCANTKIQYGRKVDHFKKWVREVHPESLMSIPQSIFNQLRRGILSTSWDTFVRRRNPPEIT